MKIVISGSFGSGWSTCNPEYRDFFMANPTLVEMVEAAAYPDEIENYVKSYISHPYLNLLGSDSLVVKEVDERRPFFIEEYDGLESIRYLDTLASYYALDGRLEELE